MKSNLLVFSIIVLLATAGFISWQILFYKKTVLFLCVHNTFRSQIAEAYFNKFAAGKRIKWQAKSAGFLKAEKINDKAVILIREEGIDISDKKPKLVNKRMIDSAAKIIVVCQECSPDSKEKFCPVLSPNKNVNYWHLPNPAEMELNEARKVRDEIKTMVLNLINELR